MKNLLWILTFALVNATPLRSLAQPTNDISSWFEANAAWARAESASVGSDGRFQVSPSPTGPLLYFTGSPGQGPQLRTHAYTGDSVIHFEFLLTPEARAGVYLEGRYKIELGAQNMGQLGALQETKSAKGTGGVAPALTPAAGEPGSWQTVEVKFRAPRFDEAGNQTQNALILQVVINGKVVQSNTVLAGRSQGTEFGWDDAGGPTTLSVDAGSMAIRNFSIRRAEFEAVLVPQKSGAATNTAKLIDFVKQGEDLFRGLGCVECHAIQADDPAVKTGPNLYGLFALEPRDRVIAGSEGHRFTVKADRGYLQRSVRTPQEELAIAERGPTTGQPFQPIMPPYAPTVLSDAQIDAIGSFLATLNEPARQGPVIRLVEQNGPKNYDPMTDRLQLLVNSTVRIQRGPMDGVSGRAIHVGQPNGINYSFDPRVLAIAKIWQGGFIDATGEYLNRGGQGFKPGFETREIELGKTGVLLAPLNAHNEPIDFAFKDAKLLDGETIRQALNSPRDHLQRVADVGAQFLGYDRNSTDPLAAPTFKYRVANNTIAVRHEFLDTGDVRLIVDGDLAAAQSFVLNESVLSGIKVSAGEVSQGRWTLPAGKHVGEIVQGKLTIVAKPWRPAVSTFNYRSQPLVTEQSSATLPKGYSSETYLGPKDNFGRDQLFEPLGLAVAPDGTLVIATRTAGIWRLVKGEWHLFAEGLFDSLGVQVEDEHGLRLVAGQKAELTRITDTDGDGLADRFETMTDAFTYHGNYHSYLHGPVKDSNGDYFITLNLDDAGQVDYEYRANGKYMGTGGGFRGWAARVPAKGGFEPWASGMRSPAGLGIAPDGRLWYADNQGEYVGTSKVFLVKQGAFYGHPAGLVDRAGMTPSSPEIAWEKVKDQREQPVILLPQNRLANSPGNPAWDTTGGKFGPFAGQMFIGDQTQSDLIRVITEKVGAHEQGVAIPYAADLQSGVMRPFFLPDGSLLLGQTGRGWQAKGGRVASLQRLT